MHQEGRGKEKIEDSQGHGKTERMGEKKISGEGGNDLGGLAWMEERTATRVVFSGFFNGHEDEKRSKKPNEIWGSR